jgi:8-hydroxy-5-deazaflavin:NADPH oxidoreductase
MKTLGLIGAGHIGSQLARLGVKNGYDVVVSNSRGPQTLADLVRELGPHARAATPEEAAKAGDIVVVTIPLKNLRDVPAAPLAGKIVIDTLNYYPQRDGHIADLDNEKTTTSELVLCENSAEVGSPNMGASRPSEEGCVARTSAQADGPR